MRSTPLPGDSQNPGHLQAPRRTPLRHINELGRSPVSGHRSPEQVVPALPVHRDERDHSSAPFAVKQITGGGHHRSDPGNEANPKTMYTTAYLTLHIIYSMGCDSSV